MQFEGPQRRTRRRTQLALLAGLWLAIAAVLVAFRSVLLPFAGGLLIAYVIAPGVDRIASLRLRRGKVPRWMAIIAVYLGIFTCIYAFSVTAVPQLYRELARITIDARDFVNGLTPQRIDELSQGAEEWLTSHGVPVDLDPDGTEPDGNFGPRLRLDLNATLRELVGGASTWLRGHLFDVVGYSQRILAGLAQAVFVFFFMLMVAGFVLVDVNIVVRFFRGLVPDDYRGDFDRLLIRADERLSGVVRGQLVICLVNGVLTLVGLLLLGVNFALVLAVLATVLSLIPIFGTIVSTIPIVLVGLSQSWSTGIAALAWILGVHALEAYFLNPKIMGAAAKIHPALIAFALLAGEQTYGLVGALLAVPAASILVAIFGHVQSRAEELQDEQ
ncbi:MAG: AI-2E family transporter [Deltaproteobacteria bacterium]|nr:AI-2E family transporter [Deltaproteobacteria bacterium]